MIGRIKKIFPLAILLLLFANCNYYNKMVEQDEAVNKAWSEIDNQLQRRNDLIPNYVETVKGYAKHESEVFTKIAEARSKLAGSQTPEDKMNASNELSSALSRLLVVVEKYPELKADTNFIRLQDELAGTENRIAVARKRYNEAVEAYNKETRKFPGTIFARMFGFKTKPYFNAPEEAKKAPQVKF